MGCSEVAAGLAGTHPSPGAAAAALLSAHTRARCATRHRRSRRQRTSSSWLPSTKGPLRSDRLKMAQAWSNRKEERPAPARAAARRGNWHMLMFAT